MGKKSNPREWWAWTQMKQRCRPDNKYTNKRYSGRGITVCERWKNSFRNFFLDMGTMPAGRYTLDRRDDEKGYSPENCRWATYREQNGNRSTYCVFVAVGGEKVCLSEACRRLGVKRNRVHQLMRVGKSFEASVELSRLPVENKLVFEIDGVKKSLIEWCKLTGVKYVTANARRTRGVPIREAIELKGVANVLV